MFTVFRNCNFNLTSLALTRLIHESLPLTELASTAHLRVPPVLGVRVVPALRWDPEGPGFPAHPSPRWGRPNHRGHRGLLGVKGYTKVTSNILYSLAVPWILVDFSTHHGVQRHRALRADQSLQECRPLPWDLEHDTDRTWNHANRKWNYSNRK